jgi:type I restriction enzyme S subunit
VKLPPGWVGTTLGEVTEIVSGSTPRTSEPSFWDGDIAWITPDDLSRDRSKIVSRGARLITQAGYDSCSTRLVPAGTVLYSSRAPIGYAAIAANPVCTNQGFKSFVPSAALTSDYLYWFLVFDTPQIRTLGSGTTFPELSRAKAQEIPIPVPPLGEQQRIVAAIEEQLSRLDAATSNFRVLRLRFDALERSALMHAVAEGEERRLGDLLEGIEAGRSFGGAGGPAGPDEWGVIRVSAMTWGDFNSEENKMVSAEDADPRWEIRQGDLLMSRANTTDYVGAAVLVRETRPRLLLSDKSLRLLVKPDVDKSWLLRALSAPQSRRQISAVATGTSDSMRNVSQEKLRAITLQVPPSDRQAAIAQRIESELQRIADLRKALNAAERRAYGLRRSILASAFRGQLVPQDPDDEPASVLLERMASERAAAPKPPRRPRERAPA